VKLPQKYSPGDFVTHGADSIEDASIVLEQVIRSRRIVAEIRSAVSEGTFDFAELDSMLLDVVRELGKSSLLLGSILEMSLAELAELERMPW